MKTLTIIIPVYNEQDRVHKAFRAVKNFKNTRDFKVEKFIFVNDGSKDKTLSLIKEFKKTSEHTLPTHAKVEILSYKKNRGRGYAVKRGLSKVTTDYGLYVDADLSMPFENLRKFVPFMTQNYDLLIGSKKKPGAIAKPQRSFIRQIVGLGHSLIGSIILGTFVWDFQGGFKMFSRRFIREIIPLTYEERWGLDMEVIFLAKKLGFLFIELPVTWRSVNEGSTVALPRDIRRALVDMIRIRRNWLSYRLISLFNSTLIRI